MRELDLALLTIEALETEQTALRAELAHGDLYARDPARANQLYLRDAVIEEEILAAMGRWDELSAKLATVAHKVGQGIDKPLSDGPVEQDSLPFRNRWRWSGY